MGIHSYLQLGGEGYGINLAYDHHDEKTILAKFYQTTLKLFSIDVEAQTCQSLFSYQNILEVTVLRMMQFYTIQKKKLSLYIFRYGSDGISTVSISKDGSYSSLSNLTLPQGYLSPNTYFPASYLPLEDKVIMTWPINNGHQPFLLDLHNDSWAL